MPRYRYVGADPRHYHPSHIGTVEPGDVRDLPVPPDVHWRLETPAAAPFTFDPAAVPGETATPDPDEPGDTAPDSAEEV